ncbi:hypothetical protein QE152_g23592 [Popillia japonica]|uniref:Uncharacterized protein n=1 Tax=Popillia japonica TaxID=7064 RepID=A0AAW1KEG6_POPJA
MVKEPSPKNKQNDYILAKEKLKQLRYFNVFQTGLEDLEQKEKEDFNVFQTGLEDLEQKEKEEVPVSIGSPVHEKNVDLQTS